MSDFRQLKVYDKAHVMMLDAHALAEKIKGTHHASLKNQIVRAAMSVPTNIVEGAGQRSGADFARFLRFSLNSSSELEYHLIAARDLKALREQQVAKVVEQVVEVRRMLYGLLRYLELRPKVSRAIRPKRDESGQPDT
ncbi:MAG TPA: four helix bundle protein [Gemmatimonadaceae bacterium]|nr:four helix bundle protein [Gemmatimonadaceae bacterium]